MVVSNQHSRFSPEVNPKLRANIVKKCKVKGINQKDLFIPPKDLVGVLWCVGRLVLHAISLWLQNYR